jgi:hypothetical protein
MAPDSLDFDACYLHQRLASLLGFPLPPLIGYGETE